MVGNELPRMPAAGESLKGGSVAGWVTDSNMERSLTQGS
jgi:hypothetical protein